MLNCLIDLKILFYPFLSGKRINLFNKIQFAHSYVHFLPSHKILSYRVRQIMIGRDMVLSLLPRPRGPQGYIFVKNNPFTSALNFKTKIANFHEHHLNINFRVKKISWSL